MQISSPFINEGGWVPSSCRVVVDPLGEKAFHRCVGTGWFLGIPTVFWRASWVGLAGARRWSIFTGAKGYPLKALFGVFFTGEFDQSERNRAFPPFSHRFCI